MSFPLTAPPKIYKGFPSPPSYSPLSLSKSPSLLVFIYISLFFRDYQDKRDRERLGLREGIERKRGDSVKGERRRGRGGRRGKREKEREGFGNLGRKFWVGMN